MNTPEILPRLSLFFKKPLLTRDAVSGILKTRLFAILSLLFIPLVLSANTLGATLIVDDGTECPGAPYTSIQAAVAAASPGDTIQVCAGTYDEDVTIGTANLFVNGAGAGLTNVRGPIGGGGSTFAIGASNVVLSNFTITRLGNNTTDWNNAGLNSAGISIQGLAITGSVIRDNVITGMRTAIDVNNSNGHTIRNNVIDFNRTGLIFRNQTDNITFVENFVTNNWTVGVLFLDASGGTNSPLQTALNSNFSNNNISGNWYGQVVDRQSGGSLPAPGTTNLKNFPGNWLGTTTPVVTTANSTEPGYAAQIPVAYGGSATAPGGQPDIAGPASANIKTNPLLQSGTDTNVETTPGRGIFGFQGVAPPCSSVSIPTGTTVLTNTQVVIPINVDDTTGRGILSYDFSLTYNPAVITPVAVETVGTLSAGWTITTASSSGTLIVSGFNTSPLTGSGVMLNIRFVASGGIGTTSNLNLPSFMFNEGVPCVNVTNGNVTVISGTVSGAITYANALTTTPVPFTTVNAAGSIPLSTTTDANGLYSLSGFGSGAYTVTPSKTNQINGITNLDASRIAQHIVGFAVLNSTQLIAADVSGNGSVTSLDAAYIAQYIVLIPNPGVTGTWKFIPPNRSYPDVIGNYTGQDYSAILMGEVTGNWNPAGPLRPSQIIERKSNEQTEKSDNLQPVVTVTAPTLFPATVAQPFTINLTTTDTTQTSVDDGIIGFQFDLFYTNSVITPQASPCDLAGTLSSGLSVLCNPIAAGHLKVVVFGTMPISGSGTLMKLKFNAVGMAAQTSPLTITNFMFNEGIPADITVDGSVVLVPVTAASVSIGGQLRTATGQPVTKATVVLTNTLGQTRTALSNGFGYYTFDDVSVGETYVVSAVSKRYTFTPMVISPTENVNELNLIAEQ